MTRRTSRNSVVALVLVMWAAGSMLAQMSTTRITGGRVEGVVQDGIASFKAIPLAAPPVGDLRWRPPQPVKPW